ncbi:unnamed protein product [Rotaria sordida]|uniref:Uncharacterized protein n=1 Tax=Rotaria sordida TaxID=392033 RepID=A0A819EJF3_9BILA|nr:unnamed protein product [Rotaria sordida]
MSSRSIATQHSYSSRSCPQELVEIEITKEFYTIRNIFLEESFVNLTGFFQIEIDRVIRAVEKSLNDLQSAMNDLIILNDSFRQILDSIYDDDAPID